MNSKKEKIHLSLLEDLQHTSGVIDHVTQDLAEILSDLARLKNMVAIRIEILEKDTR